MKLKPEEAAQLIERTKGSPTVDVIDDACEVLTMKMILLVKKKQKIRQDRLKSMKADDPKRARLVAEIQILGEVVVQMAETP